MIKFLTKLLGLNEPGPVPTDPNLIQSPIRLDNLYPKWNCPKCGDWFHLPYKDCLCSSYTKKDWKNVTERK